MSNKLIFKRQPFMKINDLFLFGLLLFVGFSTQIIAQSNEFIFGDLLPDAPELAQRGEYKVGVRTLTVVDPGRLDVLNAADGKVPTYDRSLTLEVWYPAFIPAGQEELTEYESVLGQSGLPNRPIIPFTFKGRALRDAEPDKSDGPYPLVIVSHGYTGSRLIFTYLTENLASKGYVVVSIDHTESTYQDAGKFSSTLLNRSLDDLFVLNEMAKLGTPNSNSFLANLVDANNTGLVGYSMGGYGAINVGGAGYSPFAVGFFGTMTGGSKALEIRATGNPEYVASMDDRIKAIVAFAPWGKVQGVWDAEGLKGLKVPTFFVAGSQDDISGYENGIKAIYDGAIHVDRYLLTYVNARHNVAPNPPPIESYNPKLDLDEYLRYADSVWDERRMNNINQHFVTAFLGMHLKNKDYKSFLDVKENANEELWKGFKPRTSVGLELRFAKGVDR